MVLENEFARYLASEFTAFLMGLSSSLWSGDFPGLYDARNSWNSASLRNRRSRAAVTTYQAFARRNFA